MNPEVLRLQSDIRSVQTKPRADWKRHEETILGAVGASTNITAFMTGKLPDGGTYRPGIVTDGSRNFAYISDAATGNPIDDGSGNDVYARITYAASVWTLTYYHMVGSVETAFTLLIAYDLVLTYLEVFSFSAMPTFTDAPGSEGIVVPTDEKVKTDILDPSADFLDAKVDGITLEVNTATHRLRVKPGTPFVTVGDGVNSFGDFNGIDTAIQAAINSVGPRGGCVFVKRGIYSPLASITLAGGVILEGEQSYRNDNGIYGVTINRVAGVDTVVMASNSSIRNLRFTDAFATDTAKTIKADTINNVKIENVLIVHTLSDLDYGVASISIDTCTNVRIDQCVCINGGKNLATDEGIVDVRDSDNVVIFDTYITHNRDSSYVYGIHMWDSNNCTVSQCRINSQAGLRVEGVSFPIDNIRVLNNDFHDMEFAHAGGGGVRCLLQNVTNHVVHGNNFRNNSTSPCLVTFSHHSGHVTHNTIEYSFGSGMIIASGITASEAIISHNTILNCTGEGLFGIISASKVVISHLRVRGCTGNGILLNLFGVGTYDAIVSNCLVDTCSKDGISLFKFKGICSGNHVNTNVWNGIYVNSDCSDVVITDNACMGNDSLVANSYDGIQCLASNCIISNNRCKDNNRYEINNVGGDRNVIVGNQLIGTHVSGALNDTGTNTEIGHNITA